ncbi:hypothetical protein EVG20_g853 [Dentipellis fragilis]|uniref:Uncharacterized protein n=1 Tax=Dentipellis fragilis TaxID=205917 RepID=A0A4Y9ZEH0_9AGAM|nr:hypothetical protein EVG20_g853 [Dentipellis fragilis]
MPPRPSKLIPSYTEADLAAPSMTLSNPYVDREGRGRATPPRIQPNPSASLTVQPQYRAPTNPAVPAQHARQPQHSTATGSRDTTYTNQHHAMHTRSTTNATNITNTTTTTTNPYHGHHASRQVQEAPPYPPTNTAIYTGMESAGSSAHPTHSSGRGPASAYAQPYGTAPAQARHGTYDIGRHASATQTAGSSGHGAHSSHHHSFAVSTNSNQPSAGSHGAQTAATSAHGAYTSLSRAQTSAAPANPSAEASSAVQFHQGLDFEWSFPTLTDEQARYLQQARDLAPRSDYPSHPSSGGRMQPPPPAQTHNMGPPPVSTRPATGRARSHSVQQRSSPAAALSPRSRRPSHAVPPTTIGHSSHAYAAMPSTPATHHGSTSSAHGPSMYPAESTSRDSRARPSHASQVAPPVAGPSDSSRGSTVHPSISQAQAPPEGSRTRKGKEPLRALFTRELLPFKRPAENSRPSSVIQSDNEEANGEHERRGEEWQYTVQQSVSIRRAVKRLKPEVYTPSDIETQEPTDFDVIVKGAEVIPMLKTRVVVLERSLSDMRRLVAERTQ